MANQTVREVIARDLGNEPQTIIRVDDTASLRDDLQEYVLTDQIARQFADVLEKVVDSAKPASSGTRDVGVWVSGFFGSGKSHFAKLVGHLLADTPVGDSSARELFKPLLKSTRLGDERVREQLQQASTYRLHSYLVPFDIQSHYRPDDQHAGLTFLRAFYNSLGLSSIVPFAERELEIQATGRYDEFLERYEVAAGVSWGEDKDLNSSSVVFAEVLAEMYPQRYRTTELAHSSLELGLDEFEGLTVDAVTDKLMRWLVQRQKESAPNPFKLVFVVDEVGAWTSRKIERIEQIRNFAESLGTKAGGGIWLVVTSQERLSDVVQNAPTFDQRTGEELLERLEARFRTNIHLESSEVSTVVEERILDKRPTSIPILDKLWSSRQGQLMDVAESPGLTMIGNYPPADRELFIKDYPFLPYQLVLAAELFGGMRSVRIASGARSMIKVAFDATRALADQPLGAVVSWDQIFDSANRDNEFSDENYLGSHGIVHLNTADRDVTGSPVTPTRILKVLWLMQHSSRVPRTTRNLARLLVNDLGTDVLQLERDVETTLQALAEKNFVRRDATDKQWRYLSEDEVTVEKIVQRISQQDISFGDYRRELAGLYSAQLTDVLRRSLTVGKSATPFEYGVYWNDAPVRFPDHPVQLRASMAGTPPAAQAHERSTYDLDSPIVHWVVDPAARIEELLRRAMAIERLRDDEEFQRIATERTRSEAEKLATEAGTLRRDAEKDIERVFRNGSVYYAGKVITLGDGSHSGSPQAIIEDALRDRILNTYHRFSDGDLENKSSSVERLLSASTGDRRQIDGSTGLIDVDGHLAGGHPVVEEITQYLQGTTRNSGREIADHFGDAPFGWTEDLIRYVTAAMFVDGKLSVSDKSGRRFDDPRPPDARRLFSRSMEFRTSRLEVEEDTLSPQEASRVRSLLTDLGWRPSDTTEIELRDAIHRLVSDLNRRSAVIDKAAQVNLPLPAMFDGLRLTMEELGTPAPRVTTIRALLQHDEQLRAGEAGLKQLEQFEGAAGFAQYERSQQLLLAAIQAGLEADPEHGDRVQKARAELEALREQRRIIETWESNFRTYRLFVLDAFKDVYVPLRKELHREFEVAREMILSMPEYRELPLADATTVRSQFLSDGRPLAEVDVPELRGDADLLAANNEYSIAHMRTALAALDSQLSAAQKLVLDLHAAWQEQQGEQARTVTWNPSAAFGRQSFDSADELARALDAERDRLVALIREGKTVRIV